MLVPTTPDVEAGTRDDDLNLEVPVDDESTDKETRQEQEAHVAVGSA